MVGVITIIKFVTGTQWVKSVNSIIVF